VYHYHHLTIFEQERLYLVKGQGQSLRKIAAVLESSVSTISRELMRNKQSYHPYSPSAAMWDAIIIMFKNLLEHTIKNITPNREQEFARHANVSAVLQQVPFCFADPYSLWRRGANLTPCCT